MKKLFLYFVIFTCSVFFAAGHSFSKPMDEMTGDELKELNQELTLRLEKLKAANETLSAKKASIEKEYQELLKDSPECLSFQKKYNLMLKQNEDMKSQIKQIEQVEGSMESDPQFWFLIGPGVFIVGLLFGLSSRKRKRTGLL